MQPSWLSLLPPILVVIAGFLSHKFTVSLTVGIVSAALIAQHGNILPALHLAGNHVIKQLSDVSTLYLFMFLAMVGIIVILLNQGNGPRSLARILTKKVKTQSGVEMATVFSSCVLSIDDYLSILTVGHVMRTVTDYFAIAREKLAFLIHSFAGSLVITVPISSWVAAITAYLSTAGVSATETTSTLLLSDPFYVYIKTIPYIFYSFINFFTVIRIIQKRLSFGPMQHYEQKIDRQKQENHPSHDVHNLWKNITTELLIPLCTLIISVIVGILYTGGYHLFGGTETLLDAFKKNTDIFFVLCISSFVTTIVTFALLLKQKVIHTTRIPSLIINGCKLMLPAIIMVLLATVFGSLLQKDLHTGNYLASALLTNIAPALLPVLFFIVSLIITLATGSAWGTFAIMIVIAIPMLISLFHIATPTTPELIPLLYPTLGAIFSGAICGDHISPFSETTVMAATSTEVNPFVHTLTQFPYALPALCGTIASFICIGMLPEYFWNMHYFGAIIIGLATSELVLNIEAKYLQNRLNSPF